MPSTIWNKYKLIKEIGSNENIKTYSARIEHIIKEIIPKDRDDYHAISERLEQLKERSDIYEIIEEDNKFYIVAENNEKLLSKIDKLILSNELTTKKEGIIKGHGTPVTKKELNELFEKDKAMCKISYETLDKRQGKASGFFCELENFPIQYGLFTNNHVLNEINLEIGNNIYIEYLEKSSSIFGSSYNRKERKLKITKERRVFTNKELDYTCIELLEPDGIYDYFQIDPNLFKYGDKFFVNDDIFILQYPKVNDLLFSFSYGKILSLKDNKIIHNTSTDNGSSGTPIIRRNKENYIIGLHKGWIKENKNEYKFNLATSFNSILDNIKEQYYNEINCIYIPNEYENEINLLHDYNLDVKNWNENAKNEYLKAKNINKKIFEKNIEIYVNNKKIKFDYKYKINDSKEIKAKNIEVYVDDGKIKFDYKKKINDSKEIKVKFKFIKILTNTSYMFHGCSYLKSIDLSSFITTSINDMNHMFTGCSSLESIDLSSFNTTNVNNIKNIFLNCSSLREENIKINNKNDKLLKEFEENFINI